MAVFSYRAAGRDGSIVEGAIDAPDERAAVERLRNTGVIPLQITSPRQNIRKKIALRSARADLLTFTTELATLLDAGLPLDRSLNIMASISESKEMAAVVQDILRAIREGSSFSDALQKNPRVFPKLYINMVRAGESGGVLNIVLDKLNDFLESSKELKDAVVTSMIYPAIFLCVGSVSILVLLIFVLPKFSALFTDMGTAIPFTTQMILGFSTFLRDYWWLVFGGSGAVAVLLWKHFSTPAGKLQGDRLKLRIAGDLVTKLETARYCRTLGTLLASGVPLLQALSNARDVISNQVIADGLAKISKGAKEGRGIAVPLEQSGVLPPLALSMIKVGEETGQLEAMLLKVAVTYEKSLRVALKRFISLLEPIIILGMGVVVIIIVISILLAILSLLELPF